MLFTLREELCGVEPFAGSQPPKWASYFGSERGIEIDP
jgi:hypothetical protein